MKHTHSWIIAAAGLVVVVGGGYLFTTGLLQRYAQEGLHRLIQQQLPEHYVVDYQALEFNWARQEVTIRALDVRIDTAALLTHHGRYYELHVPKFRIELKSLTSLVMDRELVIQELSFVDPHIDVKDFSQAGDFAVTSESVNILEFVGQYLRSLEVESLQIQDAALHYDKGASEQQERFRLEDIDFRLLGFRVDSTARKEHFFNAEYIELIVNQQEFYLKDGVHRASFDQFRLSTRDSLLQLTNFLLEPVGDTSNFQRPIYHIEVPSLEFDGLDYERSYLDRVFNIDQLVLRQPIIRVREPADAPAPSDSSQNALQAILDRVAPMLRLGMLQLEDAEVHLDIRLLNGRQLDFELNQLRIYDWEIDAKDLQFDRSQLPFQRFAFEIHDWQEQLPDGLHRVTLDRLYLDSEDGQLGIEQLHFQPLNSKPAAHTLKMEHRVEGVMVTGIDYWDLLFGAPLQFENITLTAPRTTLIPPLQPRRDKNFDLGTIRSVFRNALLQGGGLERLVIRNGQFGMGKELEIGNYELELRQLRFDPYLGRWKSLYGEFQWEGQEIEYTKDGNTARIGRLATDGNQYAIGEVALDWASENLKLQGTLAEVTANLLSIDSLMAGRIMLDTLRTRDLRLSGFSEARPEGRHDTLAKEGLAVTVHHWQLDNGSIDWWLPNDAHLRVDRLDLSARYDSVQELQLFDLTGLAFHAPDFDHTIDIAGIRKDSSEYSFTLSELHLTPRFDSLATRFPTYLPSVRLEGFDADHWRATDTIALSRVYFDQPSLQLVSEDQPNVDKQGGKSDLPPVKIESIQVADASFFGTLIQSADTALVTIPQLSVDVDQFTTVPAVAETWEDYLATLSVRLNRGFEVNQSGQLIQAATFAYDHREELLRLEDIRVEPADSAWKLNLSTLTSRGLNARALERENRLVANSLQLGEMQFEYQLEPKTKEQDAPSSKVLQLPFGAIQLDSLVLQQSNALLTGKDTFQLNGINLSIEQIRTDSLVELECLDDHYGYMAFSIEDIPLRIGRSDVYNIHQRLKYTSNPASLRVEQFRMQPTVSREAYSDLLEYQEDFFDLQMEELILHDWQWGAAFRRPLRLSKLELNGLKLDIYRDQRLPHPERPVDLIQKQLQEVPIEFILDTLQLTGSIAVDMQPEGTEEIAHISFDQLDGTIGHVTNLPSQRHRPMTLNAHCRVFDRVYLEAVGEFELQSPLQAFKLAGRVGEMDLQVMNEILQPTANLWIKSGFNEEITFEITANDNLAIGELFFRYNDLKFRILNAEHEQAGLGNSILSFWANRLVRSNNPSLLSKRQGLIYYERNKNRAIFNFWSRAFLSGVISSVGVKNNKKRLRKLGIEELEAVDYQEIFEEGFKVRSETQ